jgi:hypothetical protein
MIRSLCTRVELIGEGIWKKDVVEECVTANWIQNVLGVVPRMTAVDNLPRCMTLTSNS